MVPGPFGGGVVSGGRYTLWGVGISGVGIPRGLGIPKGLYPGVRYTRYGRNFLPRILIFTARNSGCGTVMFSQASVFLSGAGDVDIAGGRYPKGDRYRG